MDLKEFFRFGRDFGIMPALFHHTELKVRATANDSDEPLAAVPTDPVPIFMHGRAVLTFVLLS